MKTIIAFCALVVVVVAFPGDTYDPRYDNFNAQELADNLRLLKSYGKCFLDEGPCTPEGADFKKSIPEALRTTCAKCTPKQRELIRIVVRAFQTKLPDVWEQLAKKEDPNGEYKESFEAFLNRSD
uniref:Chemosensory protein n=1 Tax=Eogystia hippophaecolus TaxID=1206364 RepID=A0A1B3P5K5_EOGHI|nr:chemosensory protein [Eogystia hippophaecolus]